MTDAEPDPSSVQSREDLGRALTALRTRAGFSVRDLAHRIGAPAATVGGYLTGRHLPTVSAQPVWLALLAACGVEDVEAWNAALNRVRAASDSRLTRPASPYPGLAPFQPDDGDRFFGREAAVRLVLDALCAVRSDPVLPPLVAVVGPSGSGKSSLLRAGVIPAVRGGALGGENTECRLVTPGATPLWTVRDALHTGPALLVIDQFEEIFTTGADAAERARLIELLAGIDGTRTVVALGLRADFYAAATRLAGLVPTLQHAQVVVAPLTVDELREAVVEPARRVGVTVEPALVERLLRDLAPRGGSDHAHDPGALPLLSHALLSSWSRSRGSRLTVEDYEASGGIRGAIEQTAEEAFGDLSPDGRDRARRVFRRLVHVGEDAVPTRRRVPRAELDELDRPALTAEVLDHFVSRRLLTADVDTVEVTHEALLGAWSRLRRWLEDDRAGVRLQRQITEAAHAWQETHDDDALLRAGRLDTALEWTADPDHAASLTRAERDFVRRSAEYVGLQQRLARRRTRRLQSLLAAVAVLAVVASALAAYALNARDRAARERASATRARDEAMSRQIALEVGKLRAGQPSLAAQLALAGYRIAPTPEARAALLDTSALPMATRLLAPEGPMQSVAASPDGSLLAATTADGRVHLWQLAAPRPRAVAALGRPDPATTLYGVAFTPDSHALATAGSNRTVRLWDVSVPSRPRPIAALTGPTNTIFAVAFSPHGDLLAAASADGMVHLWDVSDLARPRPLPSLTRPVTYPRGSPEADRYIQSVAFGPDGRLVVGGTVDGNLVLWRPDRPQPLAVVRTSPTNALFSTAVSPDGRTALAGGRDGRIRTWDITDPAHPRPGRSLTGFASWVNGLAFSADGTRLAGGSSDDTVRIWTWPDGTPLNTLTNPTPVTSVVFLRGGSSVATSTNNGVVRLWPVADPAIHGSGASVFSVNYDSTGRRLVVGYSGAPAQLWDTSSSPPVLLAPDLRPSDPSFTLDGDAYLSPDGRVVAVGTGTGQGPIFLWDVSDPRRPRRIGGVWPGPTAADEGMAISPDSRYIAVSGDDRAVHLWDIGDLRRPRALPPLTGFGNYTYGIAFSPDGRYLAVGGADKSVQIWDVAQHRCLASITGAESYVYMVAYSADGKLLAADGADQKVRLYDVADPRHPRLIGVPLSGPTDYLFSLAISPDGSILAAGGQDEGVWLWNVSVPDRPEFLGELAAADGHVDALAFAPHGLTLAAATSGGSVKFWSLSTDAVARSICARAGDPITQDEWRRYVPGVAYNPPCR